MRDLKRKTTKVVKDHSSYEQLTLPFLYYVLTSADTETKSTYTKLLLILTNRMIDKSELSTFLSDLFNNPFYATFSSVYENNFGLR